MIERLLIVVSLIICGASDVISNFKKPSAKNEINTDLKLLVFVISTYKNIY